jgi:hypothetical protein
MSVTTSGGGKPGVPWQIRAVCGLIGLQIYGLTDWTVRKLHPGGVLAGVELLGVVVALVLVTVITATLIFGWRSPWSRQFLLAAESVLIVETAIRATRTPTLAIALLVPTACAVLLIAPITRRFFSAAATS